MRVFECPAVYSYRNFIDRFCDVSIFLAGGITDCPDWQKEMIQRFKGYEEDLVLLNPRRKSFDVKNPADSAAQIEWEHLFLDRADAILFWFPYHTLCPITLYELGVHAAKGDKIFVGCHPAYPRKFDVEKQLSLLRPDVQVHDNFGSMVDEISAWLGDVGVCLVSPKQ